MEVGSGDFVSVGGRVLGVGRLLSLLKVFRRLSKVFCEFSVGSLCVFCELSVGFLLVFCGFSVAFLWVFVGFYMFL